MASEGPGRLSSIDLVPEEGREDVLWALGQLNERARSQADILSDLNGRLADKGLQLISKSAFNRRAVRIYAQKRRDEEARAVYAELAKTFTPEKISEGDLVLGELIKTLVSEMLDASAGEINTAGALELARAYKAVIEGQTLSLELRRQADKEMAAKVNAAIDTVAKTRGLSADAAKDIRAQILGVKE